MAKPWVEGGYYEECSGKWGWKNKMREITNVKWLKNQLNKSEIKKYNKYNQEKKRVTYTNEERRENIKVKAYEKLGEIKW